MSATHSRFPLLVIVLLAVTQLPACGPRTFCDCAWSGSVTAWFDANENAMREENEPPLAGVRIRSSHGESDITNPSGEAIFDIWSPGCPCGRGFDLRFEAEPPMGYRHTT